MQIKSPLKSRQKRTKYCQSDSKSVSKVCFFSLLHQVVLSFKNDMHARALPAQIRLFYFYFLLYLNKKKRTKIINPPSKVGWMFFRCFTDSSLYCLFSHETISHSLWIYYQRVQIYRILPEKYDLFCKLLASPYLYGTTHYWQLGPVHSVHLGLLKFSHFYAYHRHFKYILVSKSLQSAWKQLKGHCAWTLCVQRCMGCLQRELRELLESSIKICAFLVKVKNFYASLLHRRQI